MAKVAIIAGLLALVAAHGASGQAVNPQKGQPLLIQPGNTPKLIWRTRPPHPDAVMCCGGALQLSWSPMDSGVDHSVVLNIDDTCPSTLKNQQYVQYIFQAAPRGLVTLDFNQNGDYYISDGVANHCSQQGMQFLLAVRGCPTDNTIYTPVVPINVNCKPQQPALGAGAAAGAGAAGGMSAMAQTGMGAGTGAALGAGGAAGQRQARAPPAAAANGAPQRGGGRAAGVAAAAAVAAALLLAL